jgi:hypothetical protein
MIPVPSLVLGLLALVGPVVWGYMYVQGAVRERAAYNRGFTAGTAADQAAQVRAATETTNALRDALSTTPIPTSPDAVRALCKQSMACRDRGNLK